MSGHVFIVRGDLRRFACDAWLVPCDVRAAPESFWFLDGYTGARSGARFVLGGSRVQPLLPAAPNRPRPWLCWIGWHGQTPAWYVNGALEFLTAVARDTPPAQEPFFGRERALLALPVVGTGWGGGMYFAGEILKLLLPALAAFVEVDPRFDVALVCLDADIHAAAQAERAHRAELGGRPAWPDELTPALRAEADALAERARHGDLALFLGAGVSTPAGLPGWGRLLDELAAEQAGRTAEDCAALRDVKSSLDQASVIERWLEARGKSIGTAVGAVLGRFTRYALGHALLAALPVREVVTTNYDQLFDAAWALSDPAGLSILPGGIKPDARRWLLKMHGCLSRPERVVLTRSSYIRYDEGLPALAGLVQAFLLTRHMLFVGFSLTDDNFHRLVDGVRRLRGPGKSLTPIGTALALGGGGLAEVLWAEDVRRVQMDSRTEPAGPADAAFPLKAAARRLEIFLDYLVSRTRDSAHLLVGERFDGLLEGGERALRDALVPLLEAIRGPDAAAVRATAAWPQIERLLIGLGYNVPSGSR